MPVVFKKHFLPVLEALDKKYTFSLDLETTGLNPYLGAKIFSLILSTDEDDYYFNFNSNGPEDATFHISQIKDILKAVDNSKIYIHNAKFDLRFLKNIGIDLSTSTVWCTEALSRLVNNRLPSYSLSNMGKLIGYEKDDTVEKYISKHKLYTLVDVGKAKPRKDKHYDQVPFEIMSKYGMRDGRVCYELGEYITKRLIDMDLEQVEAGLPPLLPLVETEVALTKVLLEMEHTGIKIDVDYTRKAYEYQRSNYLEIEEKFYALTGIEFSDSRTVLKKAFDKMGLEHGYTDKGNPSFKEEVLPNNTLGNLIRDWRKSYKLANTYYRNFLDLGGEEGIIHTNFRQGGTATGRFSCSEPNLQNVPKHGEDTNKYPVRSCFIPREDYFFLMIDYDQMEYRLLLDLAGEEQVINKILSEGLDVHTATADEMDVERHAAKTLNFMLLYGGGAQKLADALSTSLGEAKAKKAAYFSTLKKVKYIVSQLINTVERRKWVVNPFGRRLLLPVEGSYKIPNHYIQGGCGDIVKKAMVQLDDFLKPFESRMLLQVHDELLFELHKDELHIIDSLVYIMRDAYSARSLPLTAGTDYSITNWYDKKTYEGVQCLESYGDD